MAVCMTGVLSNAESAGQERLYEIWESAPAPNRGHDFDIVKAGGKPYDEDWEQWSYPIGNGYAGANIFGRTDTERIQISDKTLHNKGCYGMGGATSFAELFIDFKHGEITGYRRSLNLNDAIAHVEYQADGVHYHRDYFASYPDNLIVVRLGADKKGALSLTVRPEIPYLDQDQRSGTVTASGNLVTIKGTIPFFNCNYEGQIKVLNEGGSVTANAEKGTLTVQGADAVTLLIAVDTNYELSEHIFTAPNEAKLDSNRSPHDAVTKRIAQAASIGYEGLKKRHLADYQNLFGRVSVNLGASPPAEPTHRLLEQYQKGNADTWLEELMFQYGRYLLIASSREKTLPANLQGVWTQYYLTPWTGGYWHNINVQMNYWGAMSANLPECFESYIAYFNAYLPKAREQAEGYVKGHNRDRLDDFGGDNGWIIGTAANAYNVTGPGGHSGPGTGGFTSKLLMDYYLFTHDRAFLESVAYPAMLSLSKFYAKALVSHGELLLVEPSASPENEPTPDQLAKMPEHRRKKGYYVTTGCTFDQGFVWEAFNDTLILAEALGEQDPFLDTIREQITKLDPIQVGTSGQIKEYREEQAYSEIGDPHHRHISHLCPLYPGTLIDSSQPKWMEAAGRTLDLRGHKTTGWALAHRMNCRARLKQGEKAHQMYQYFIRERAVPNLWAMHPPFQIDGNLGTMAGVVEMLLQSHEDYIDVLPALPKAWNTGSFSGLVARGNFVVSAGWQDGKVTAITVLSRGGGECRLQATGIASATVTDKKGTVVPTSTHEKGIRFATHEGELYRVAVQLE